MAEQHLDEGIRLEAARADRRLAQLFNPRPRKGRPRRFGPDVAAAVLADYRAGTAVADMLQRYAFAKATLYRLVREAAAAEAAGARANADKQRGPDPLAAASNHPEPQGSEHQ